jgi:hypothetical protein
MKKLFTLLALAIIDGCSTKKNTSPPPTVVPASMTENDVEYVLISCLGSPADQERASPGMYMANELLHHRFGGEFIQKRYWGYEGRGNGEVFAGFNSRKYYMRVRMAYNTKNIRFSIIDSRNLKQSKTRIHKSALRWLGGLESGIRSCLGEYDRLRYERGSFNSSSRRAP